MLRRLKADVKIHLPDKNEQVLFCRLTEYQVELYRDYIRSSTVEAMLNRGKEVGVYLSLSLLSRLVVTKISTALIVCITALIGDCMYQKKKGVCWLNGTEEALQPS